MFTVRPMEPDDIRPLLLAAADLHQKSAFSHMTFDAAKLVKLWQTSMSLPNRCFAEVIDHQGDPVGLLWAVIDESFFGPDLMSNDLLFFVFPEYHGACLRQLREITNNYRAWAERNGAKMINLGCSTQIRAEAVRLLFERIGFPMTGTLHSVTIH